LKDGLSETWNQTFLSRRQYSLQLLLDQGRGNRPTWKETTVDSGLGDQVFKSFQKLFLANYSPDVGLFRRNLAGNKIRYVATPMVKRACFVRVAGWFTNDVSMIFGQAQHADPGIRTGLHND
jgi:hypothetical protein